jgi:hypothetical protein
MVESYVFETRKEREREKRRCGGVGDSEIH